MEGIGDLATLYPNVAAQWHPSANGELRPTEVSPGAKRKVWWQDKHAHEWVSTVKDRVAGHHCPLCSGRVPIVGQSDLASQRPEVAAQWHPTRNGGLTPEDVTFGSAKKVWWLCPDGHEWETRVTYRTVPGGTGCPLCYEHWSRGEKEVAAFVAATFPDIEVIENDRDLLGGRLELDVYLPRVKVGIEYNGLYWHDESKPEVRAKHKAKGAAARLHDLRLVIVWEDDWQLRRSDVERALTQVIDGDPVPSWLSYMRVGERAEPLAKDF